MIFRSLLLAALLGFSGSAAAAPTGLSPYHEPPWLIQRGTSPTLAYALLPGSATGTVFVRSDLQRSYARIVLRLGTYCPGDPADAAAMRRDKVCGSALIGRVPRSLTSGSKLIYYAVIRDHGRSVRTPTQRVWIVRRFDQVQLGAHRFGRITPPAAIVARTGPDGVGLACCADPPGGDGPSSFDVARDGSIWVLDRLNHRLLVWRPGSSGRPARSVSLPGNLFLNDFALGPGGLIYARSGDHVYAFTSTGRVRWSAAKTAGIAMAQLQLGPDGRLYAVQECGLPCAPFGGHLSWVPLTTTTGRPLSPAERSRGANPFEPLPGGLRLVTQLSYTRARFAVIDAADRIVRAWSIRSRSRMSGLAAAPALVNGDLVLPLEVSAQQHWEKLVVRIAPGGTVRSSITLADRRLLGEVNLFATLRVSSDGNLFQLRTSLEAGASVARYGT